VDAALENKRKRLVLLNYCYEIYFSPGSNSYVDVQQVAPGLGLTESEAEQAAHQLIRDGLLRDVATPWLVEISARGIRQVELAAEQPSRGTEYFPATVIYQVNIETMSHSQVQQGTTSSTQSGSWSSLEVQHVQNFLNQLRNELPDLGLSAEDREVAEAQIATVDAQLDSPRRSETIIRESMKTLRSILEGVAGSAAAAQLLQQLDHLL
jgi:hypothetical protein